MFTCPISSYVFIFIAAKKPISEKIIQFKINTTKNSGVISIFAPNTKAKTRIIAEEISPLKTEAKTFPITNESGFIGAIRYYSRLL